MNMVCYELVRYERDLLWTGLLWTWSVINGSVMNGSVKNVVCFEWSVLSGLLWAGLFWTVTVWNSYESAQLSWFFNVDLAVDTNDTLQTFRYLLLKFFDNSC